jgi:hypothetical protein
MIQNYLIAILIAFILSIIFSAFFDPKPFKSKNIFKFSFIIKLIGISITWPIFSIVGLLIICYKLKQIYKNKNR